jgi:UPF0755 protein
VSDPPKPIKPIKASRRPAGEPGSTADRSQPNRKAPKPRVSHGPRKTPPKPNVRRKADPKQAKQGKQAKEARSHAPSVRSRALRYTALSSLAFVLALVLGFGTFVLTPGPGDGSSVEVEWNAPASPGEAADLLAQAGLVRSAFLASLYLRLDGHWDRVESGAHLLQDDMPPRTLLRRLRRLQGGAEVRVTVPEGFDKFDVARRLHEAGVCSQRALLKAANDATLMAELRLPARDAEGYLFPATYSFARNQSPASIVRRMVNESIKRHAGLFDEHAEVLGTLQKDLGWDRHAILVLASIVEKEAGVDEERPIIASVFLNRMYSTTFRPKQRLQSDPTARYGCLLEPSRTPTCEGADKGVTGPMVRDPANPYSTYAHAGLPPGPICNPSERSLRAVLAPAKTNYLYFVAKGGGRHKFSESYDDHRDAIRGAQPTP